MGPATEEILRSAVALPEEERAELIEGLLAAQAEIGGLPFDPSWLEEIQKRSAQIDQGGVTLTSWEVVKNRVRERVRGNPSG